MSTLATAAMAPLSAAAERNVAADGVSFDWRYDAGRLHATLEAPTDGWIAAGFNNARAFEGTRFVIAAVSASPIVVEEHVALVPDHRRIESLGGTPGVADAAGGFANRRSQLRFSLPLAMPAPYALNLAPGTRVRLMLAWSMERDFDHHSAWRREFDIVL